MDAMKSLFTKYFGNTSASDIFSAIIVLIICLIVIKILMHLFRKVIAKSKMDIRMQKFAINGVKIAMYIVAVLIVVDALGVPVTSLVALLSVASLAVSLAIQGMLSNLAGGIVILSAHPFNIGDYVEAAGLAGTVQEIDLIYTKLDTPDGQRVLVPNSDMCASKITNFSSLGTRRIKLTIGASYDCSVSDVRAAFMEAVESTEHILPDPAPAVYVEEYQDSAITYTVYCWSSAADYWTTRYALNENVKAAFDAHSIEMTYNHLNVHILDK